MNDDRLPRVDVTSPGGDVRAVVLVLHGGRSHGRQPVRGRQLSVVRMVPFARALTAAGGPVGLAVWRVRYRLRGWNGEEASPVRDVREVLERVNDAHPGIPVALVGYSMGGRVAIRTAASAPVGTVVALAPWVTDVEQPEVFEGRRVLFMHGTKDHTTDGRQTAAFATRVAPWSTSCGMVRVRGDGHAMVRRAALWHRLTTGFVVGGLGLAPMSTELDEVLRRNGAAVEL